MAEALVGVLKNEDGNDMTADEIKAAYLSDGNDHFITAEDAIKIGLATGYADFDAENIPDNITAMKAIEVFAHFGYDAKKVEASTTDIENFDLWQTGCLLNQFVNVMSLCDDLEESENIALSTFAKKISIQTANAVAELATLLQISEKDDVQAVAAKLRTRITAQVKPQTDVVAQAEVAKIEAKVTALTTDLTAAKALADEAKAQVATAQAEVTAKATALEAAQTEIAALQAKIPGAAAAPEVKGDDKKNEKVEAKGWEKYLTPTDKENLAKGLLKIN